MIFSGNTMEKLTVGVSILTRCCAIVLFVSGSAHCVELPPPPNYNESVQIDFKEMDNSLIVKNHTLAKVNNAQRDGNDVNNDTSVTKITTLMAGRNNDKGSVTSHDGLKYEYGYNKIHEDIMKCPFGNSFAGQTNDMGNHYQNEHSKLTEGTVGHYTQVMNQTIITGDLPKMCPPFTDADIFSFVNTDLEPKYCSTTQYQHDIQINSNKECSKDLFVNISFSTIVSVRVDGAVSNCIQNIYLVSTWPYSSIIFKIKEFDVLEQKGKPEPTCADALEIFEVYKRSKDGALLSRIESGPYCNLFKSTHDDVRYIQHDIAKLSLRLSNETQCKAKMSFNVIAVPCRKPSHKDCDCKEYAGLNQGVITSPGFLDLQRYPNNVACKWSVSVTEENFIQLDFTTFRLGKGDSITITVINGSKSLQFPRVLIFNDSTKPIPLVVVPSNKCVLEFRSDEFVTSNGFSLNFQAVAKTRFMPLLDNNVFNCSEIAYIPDSIRCNLMSECADGQDEENCSYKHPDCPGGFVFEDTCLILVQNVRDKFSWKFAQGVCINQFSSKLITFKTERKRKFYDKLRSAYRINNIFLGLMRRHRNNILYRRSWLWVDGTRAFYLPNEVYTEFYVGCSLFRNDHFETISCDAIFDNVTIVCEKPLHLNKKITFPTLPIPKSQPWTNKIDVFMCNTGERITIDQRCDRNANCFDKSDEDGCGDYTELINKRFRCDNLETVAYSFVCDGIDFDCSDNSDEIFCFDRENSYNDRLSNRRQVTYDPGFSDYDPSKTCPANTTSCPGLYCLPDAWITDGEVDCPVRDWRGKRVVQETVEYKIVSNIPPPGVVYPDGHGKFVIKPLRSTEQCPSTHEQCVDGFCIPRAMFGNLYHDCPYHEDEHIDRLIEICRGAYRCRRKMRCISFQEICDGKFDCPYYEDETLCKAGHSACPIGCSCVHSKEFVCTNPFRFDKQPQIKAHSFSISGTSLPSVRSFKLAPDLLIFLAAPRNSILNFESDDFRYPNLKLLNMSFNNLSLMPQSAFKHCLVLESLSLESNFIKDLSFLKSSPNLKTLDLSRNPIHTIKDKVFVNVPKLEILNLRNMGIYDLRPHAFWGLRKLTILNLKGNKILKFSTHVFDNQISLFFLSSDNFRLCCKQIAPSRLFKGGKCVTSFDEISSCDDMLRTRFLRISLWVMALLTVLGNIGVICHRIFWNKSNRLTYRILITCLSLSDLLMGVYLVIIGITDIQYRNRFLSMEEEWKNSITCRIAGHLCVLSSEVSAMLILVVTVDRAIAVALPLRQELQMSTRTVASVCVFVWLAGMTIASIPTLPPFNSWELYSQLAVGVPLPFTRHRFPGYGFAFAIFIVLNVTTFILVVLGQLVIWLAIKKRSKVLKTEARMKQDLAIAQKLFLVVLTDCVCWFPVSMMGLLAFQGVAVPGTMNIIATVFLLPANSALNPFLYTLNSKLLKCRLQPSTSSLHFQ